MVNNFQNMRIIATQKKKFAHFYQSHFFILVKIYKE